MVSDAYRVIGFCGVSGAGKDYVANLIAQELTRLDVSHRILSIADQPKKLLAELKSWPLDVFYTKKEEYPLNSLKNYREILIDFAQNKKITDGEAVWINCALKELEQERKKIGLIPDVRFDVEWNEIKKVYPNSILVKVVRPVGNPINRTYSVDQQITVEPDFVWQNLNPSLESERTLMSDVNQVLTQHLKDLTNAELFLCLGVSAADIEKEFTNRIPDLPKSDNEVMGFLHDKGFKRLLKLYQDYSERKPPEPVVIKKTL
jgi:hypothetical protein